MKLNEMADIISGLASSLREVLKPGGSKDLHAVSECFRQFGDENVSSFCRFVSNAKNGKATKSKEPAKLDEAVIHQHVAKIQHFLDNQTTYEHAILRRMAGEIGQLKNAEIKEIGDRIGCPVSGNKKSMVAQIEDWLIGIKRSSDQSSFFTAGAGAS